MSGIARASASRLLRQLALTLAATAALASCLAARASADSKVAATWDVVSVGPHARSLDLVFITGGCLSPTADASVVETAASVTVTVTLTDQSAPGVACPDFARYATTSVPLSAPLAVRVIRGRPAAGLNGYAGALINVGGHLDVRVPRLVGLAPADANHTLDLDGLRERILPGHHHQGLARVTAQTPRVGHLVHQRATVGVRISPGAG